MIKSLLIKLVTLYRLRNFKQERFIEEAVRSALSQDYSPLEIVISDDCSPDNTFSIIEELIANYNGPHKIVLNRNERNLGLAENINGQTLELGSGELATTGDIATLLCEIGEVDIRPEFGAIPERAMEQVRVAAVNNTSEKIGWQPKVSLRQGLSNTLLFYKQQLDSGQIKL